MYCWSALKTSYAMVAVVNASSVVRDHISKTEQDRPIVAVEHYCIMKLASLILLAHSGVPPRRFLGRYSGVVKYKICANINAVSCSTWR